MADSCRCRCCSLPLLPPLPGSTPEPDRPGSEPLLPAGLQCCAPLAPSAAAAPAAAAAGCRRRGAPLLPPHPRPRPRPLTHSRCCCCSARCCCQSRLLPSCWSARWCCAGGPQNPAKTSAPHRRPLPLRAAPAASQGAAASAPAAACAAAWRCRCRCRLHTARQSGFTPHNASARQRWTAHGSTKQPASLTFRQPLNHPHSPPCPPAHQRSAGSAPPSSRSCTARRWGTRAPQSDSGRPPRPAGTWCTVPPRHPKRTAPPHGTAAAQLRYSCEGGGGGRSCSISTAVREQCKNSARTVQPPL